MKNKPGFHRALIGLSALLMLLALSDCGNASMDFVLEEEEFQSPPESAKPRVWWHWMNGNITKDGIQKDLEWMSRTGIGGFQNFDANLFTPQVVEEKLVFMTPEWKEAFKFATDLAAEKGLEMAIAGSPGWSVTGGPWVEPEDAMKKFVWTETRISGGGSFRGQLPKPPSVIGKYQNVSMEAGGFGGGYVGEPPQFYRDAAVIAFRLPDHDIAFTELSPVLSSSGGEFHTSLLSDGDLEHSAYLPPEEVGKDMWIQYAFETPQTFKAMGIAGASQNPLAEFRGAPGNRSLQVSDDGVAFRELVHIPGSTVPFNTVSFPATTARYWRMCFTTLPPQVNVYAALAGMPAEEPEPEGVQVAEFVLYTTDRIGQVEDKAGFSPWPEIGIHSSDGDADCLALGDIVDLRSHMTPEGILTWEVPEGQWSVLRFGYSLTGRQNHPASPEATGLEVDKLDPGAVRRYINTYLDMYADATGGRLGEDGLGYVILDSYEAGHMNWTTDMANEFGKRRGYDLVPWIPVLTGRVVKDPESSEKFLWDFRRTIGEMIVENHYDAIGEELHKRGMKRYTESHENRRIYLADGMDVKRRADIPMAAMWAPNTAEGLSSEEPRSEADIRESASVANIYGKPYVAAESMTAIMNGFAFYPERLKRTADLEMASGLNRFVIHTSVHQPLDDKKPGFSLGPFGQYFTRHETWAEYARPWVDYLARSCYMFQQGRNVADILYYYGENNNITWICRDELPEIPDGFEFDFVNSTALLQAIDGEKGKLVAKSGNSYEVLVLDESARYMTLPVLKKIRDLVRAGVKVVGERPLKSPSLADDALLFQQIADEVWESENITTLEALGLEPDVLITGAGNEIRFRHRRTPAEDIYWFNNRSESPTGAEISFRISGKVPLLWDPQTGRTEEVSYRISGGRTTIPLELESWDAFFIVFRERAKADSYTRPQVDTRSIARINGPWKLRIAGKEMILDRLFSYPEHADPDIRYFAGTASYSNSFPVEDLGEGLRYEIDLGQVKYLAEVLVNGQALGVAWKTPFRLDITSALKTGENDLEIKVVNLWVNRLIGDVQPGTEPSTFTTMPFYQPDSPLLPSGLMGPVKIISWSH